MAYTPEEKTRLSLNASGGGGVGVLYKTVLLCLPLRQCFHTYGYEHVNITPSQVMAMMFNSSYSPAKTHGLVIGSKESRFIKGGAGKEGVVVYIIR